MPLLASAKGGQGATPSRLQHPAQTSRDELGSNFMDTMREACMPEPLELTERMGRWLDRGFKSLFEISREFDNQFQQINRRLPRSNDYSRNWTFLGVFSIADCHRPPSAICTVLALTLAPPALHSAGLPLCIKGGKGVTLYARFFSKETWSGSPIRAILCNIKITLITELLCYCSSV